ncbi:hypothetical protein CNR22_05695 [Sphingobacteriaceae bacterium]|nr:hypothetical protein CNR22_05695 [Sphingobacteriaceae bacterium]
MKKIITILIFLLSLQIPAQKLFKGVGVFGALTVSKHEYRNKDDDQKADTPYVYNRFYPQTHVSKEFLNWGAGIFLELSRNENVRWQTELEYMNKGAKEMGVLNYYTGERSGAYSNNKLTYIQWNNYIKFWNPIFSNAHWYFMAGVRLEYLFRSSATVYPDVVASFPKFWFSGDLAVGYEFPVTQKIGVFVEQHWNPDIIPHKYNGNTNVRARSFETRVGLTYRPRKRRIDDCNAPVYKGPAF